LGPRPLENGEDGPRGSLSRAARNRLRWLMGRGIWQPAPVGAAGGTPYRRTAMAEVGPVRRLAPSLPRADEWEDPASAASLIASWFHARIPQALGNAVRDPLRPLCRGHRAYPTISRDGPDRSLRRSGLAVPALTRACRAWISGRDRLHRRPRILCPDPSGSNGLPRDWACRQPKSSPLGSRSRRPAAATTRGLALG